MSVDRKAYKRKWDSENRERIKAARLARKNNPQGPTFEYKTKRKDMLGLRVGRLVVVSKADNSKEGLVSWNTICDCGKGRIVTTKALRRALKNARGGVCSCGCFRNKAKYNSNWKHGLSDSPEMKMLWDSKCRSKKDNIPFSITFNDIKIPDKCPLLGIPLVRSGFKNRDSSPSLDRIVTSMGYIPGNVWVVSYRANRLKSNATLDELKMLVENLEAKMSEVKIGG